jgi:integrase
MGIHIREKGGIKTWYYNMRVDRHRHRGWLLPVSHMTKRRAQAEYDRIKAEFITGYSPLNPKKPVDGKTLIKQTFKNYLEYLETHHASTYASVKYSQDNFKFFYNLEAVTAIDITAYQRKRMKDGKKGATINRELQYCKAAFNRAVAHGLIDRNPFTKFDKFEEYERTRYLTENEMKELLENAGKSGNPHLKTIIETGILTGMRKQEILTLHKDQIDFILGTITIEPEKEKNNKRKQVPLPVSLKAPYQRLLAESNSGYLFENQLTKKPLTDVKRSFGIALKNSGISNFHFHDLRHTFATYALVVSNDIRAVQELLGHNRIQTTQKYAHVLKGRKNDTIEKLGAMLKLG